MPRRRTVTSPSFDPGDIDGGGGGSDDDSGGSGGGDDGGSTGPSRQGRDDRTDGDAGASVTVPAPDDDGGGSPGGSTPPTGDVGGPDTVDDTGAGDSDPRNAPSAQQPETGTDTPNIEGGDQRLFNEAAEQRRDRQQSAAQSGGDQRLRNEATPNIEGGDQRLFNEAAEQRRPEEQFGDDPVQNPVTGNRLETDLEGLSDRFQSGATDALRSVSARPDRTGVSTVRQTAVETADPFQLALAAKEGVEFVGDVRDRVPADDISNQERLDALADGELPESDSRESFVDDVEERTGAIARGTVDRATSSPGEFGLEVATGFVGGTVAASAARRGTQVARSADVSGRVSDELDAVRTFARDDRAMADFRSRSHAGRRPAGRRRRVAGPPARHATRSGHPNGPGRRRVCRDRRRHDCWAADRHHRRPTDDHADRHADDHHDHHDNNARKQRRRWHPWAAAAGVAGLRQQRRRRGVRS